MFWVASHTEKSRCSRRLRMSYDAQTFTLSAWWQQWSATKCMPLCHPETRAHSPWEITSSRWDLIHTHTHTYTQLGWTFHVTPGWGSKEPGPLSLRGSEYIDPCSFLSHSRLHWITGVFIFNSEYTEVFRSSMYEMDEIILKFHYSSMA